MTPVIDHTVLQLFLTIALSVQASSKSGRAETGCSPLNGHPQLFIIPLLWPHGELSMPPCALGLGLAMRRGLWQQCVGTGNNVCEPGF